MYDEYVKDVIKIYDKEQDEYEELEKKNLPHEKEHEEEHKIAEKYDKLLLKNNDKYNILFRYDLLDAWGVQISTLIITDDKENNMWCVYDNENQKDELANEYFTVDTKEIKDIINKYKSHIVNREEIENSSVLDGVQNVFYFSIDKEGIELHFDNLWACDGSNYIIDFLDELYPILYKVNDHLHRCLYLGQ